LQGVLPFRYSNVARTMNADLRTTHNLKALIVMPPSFT